MQVFLAVSGLCAMFMGHAVWGLIAFLGWFALDSQGRGAPQYALVDPHSPRGPREAALLAMLPEQALRRLDDLTYAVHLTNGVTPVVEIWHAVADPSLSEVWFDLELGAAPRVAGHADRVGPLLDAELLSPTLDDCMTLRSRWLCWTTAPGDRSLPELLDRVHEFGRRLTQSDVRGAQAREALQEGSPLLQALVMLAEPAYFELKPRAQSIRPSWRWLARDTGVCRQARARAVRLLARSGDPAEVMDLIEKVSTAPAESLPSTSRLPVRLTAFLDDECRHVQIAALALLERTGTAAQQAMVAGCSASRRKHRGEVKNAVLRTLAAIEHRHGAVHPGALAIVAEVGDRGRLGVADDGTEDCAPESD